MPLLYFCAEISLYYSANFVGGDWGCKIWFCSLAQGTVVTLLILTHTTQRGFERCACTII